MRSLAILALVAATGLPAPGTYCAAGPEGGAPIFVGPAPGEISIDGEECHGALVTGGQLRAARCFTNSFSDRGSPYVTDFLLREDGTLRHADTEYRRLQGGLCH
ncbi:hypothetical protein MMSR116_16175 [Methylobacterium mesophilicum SR1.6/6]|uniref:Uncharacterized protein n=1 Tax=Methylobacterium mesophilicum SR1.6/6 TaxID=908290 RepID=A0A6B9FMY2_9HYPH|nr:hypothetical protein [Methylobacterium mesophilicum]QGY03249.1 hypothetical protein MMSR116_16175 [Methylobacterium mesophilicum SR1.6/6]